jgi:hypothetical protein
VGSSVGADTGEDFGKDFGAGVGAGFGKDFSAAAMENVGADGLGDTGVDTGGSRSLHASGTGGAGRSECSLLLLLVRRGLDAPDAGGEVRSRSSLISSLTRRGLDAPGEGGNDDVTDVDGDVGRGFGVDEVVVGDFGADWLESAGATLEGFCGVVGKSKNVTSQSCGKTLIFYTPEFRPERKRASMLARSCALYGRSRLGARSPSFASILSSTDVSSET